MKFVCFLLLMSFSLLASSLEKVTKLLPKDVSLLSLHQTSPEDAEKILGKANLKRGNVYYWERNGFKYSLQLKFDGNKKLKSYHYTFSEKPAFDDFNVNKLVPAGKYYRYTENNLEMMVDPVNKKLYSVKIQ